MTHRGAFSWGQKPQGGSLLEALVEQRARADAELNSLAEILLNREPTVDEVWAKASFIDFVSELDGIRADAYGNKIRRSDYGNRNSQYGWEKDHIVAVANGGSNHLSNMQPLHWRANLSKSDNPVVDAIMKYRHDRN